MNTMQHADAETAEYLLAMSFVLLCMAAAVVSAWLGHRERRRDGRISPEDPRSFWTWDPWRDPPSRPAGRPRR